jgi:hypothetical protein
LKLQELDLAEEIYVVYDRQETKEFLESLTIETLLEKDTWPRLRGVVQIDPSGCVLPERSSFNDTGPRSFNIARVRVKRSAQVDHDAGTRGLHLGQRVLP